MEDQGPGPDTEGGSSAEDRFWERYRLLLVKAGVKEGVVVWYRLMVLLMYGAGLRLMECVRLRVKDVDLERRVLTVRDGKGAQDRVTVLPTAAVECLRRHLASVRTVHEADVAAGHGEVYLPGGLARKWPRAGKEWTWHWVFPSDRLSVDPRAGKVRRHHVSETGIQTALKNALRQAGVQFARAVS